jgi:hypothetical protein
MNWWRSGRRQSWLNRDNIPILVWEDLRPASRVKFEPRIPRSSPLHQRFRHLLTYLRSWARLKKLSIVQPLKNFPAFYGTRRIITVFTRALRCSLSWARSIQSIPSHPFSKVYSILSTHLRLGLPSGLFPSAFPTNILYAFPFSPFVLHALPI